MITLLLRHKYKLLAAFLLGMVAVFFLWAFFGEGVIQGLPGFRDEVTAFLKETNPIFFFMALAIGPLLFAPVTIFYLTAGVYGVPMGLAIVWGGIAANMALAHWLANGFMRPVLERWISKTSYRLPVVKDEDAVKVTLIARFAPGLPLCIQSYLLGLAGVKFWPYLIVSCAVQWVMSAGLILLGDSLFKGKSKMALVALSIIIVVSVGVSLLKKRYGKSQTASEPALRE